MAESKRYRAFLSYSHRDEAIAKKLHRALENYRLPRNLPSSAEQTLGPIFRDQDEMGAASDLSDRIKSALKQSDYLIVMASPSARTSNWVNDEIRFFREMKSEDNILCALIDDNPSLSFPDALLETGREPLAANLTRKNFRLGITQLAASMLDLGLDDLIQRDLRKMRRRVMAITVSACTALLVMGSLTWAALSARELAEQRRQDAEGQIEFMITDLKDDLESVGRLDALNSVGQRAVDYYDNYPIREHDNDALGRRARVFHMLGSVQDTQGNLDEASDYFTRAYEATNALLKKSPQTPDRIFEHSQSAFWVGNSYYRIGDYGQAEEYFELYSDHTERLAETEGETQRVKQERIYALSNLSSIYLRRNQSALLRQNLAKTITEKTRYLEDSPDTLDRRLSLAKSHKDLANLEIREGNLQDAINNLDLIISLLEAGETEIKNFKLEAQNLVTHQSLASTKLFAGYLTDAENEVAIAENIAANLLAIEADNTDVRFQVFQTKLNTFHIAYNKGDIAKVETAAKDIFRNVDSFDIFEPGDTRRLALSTSTQAIPLYMAILRNDPEQMRVLAERLKSETNATAFKITTSGRLNRDFLSYLLAASVLNETEQSEELFELCKSDIVRLTFQEKSALSTVFDEMTCPVSFFENTHPTTSFRTAIKYLNSRPKE